MPHTEHEERSRGASAPPVRRRFIDRPRLRSFDYVGCYVYHLVVVTRNRELVLTGELTREVSQTLGETADAAKFELLAFSVMPDHVHILAHGTQEDANAIRFIQRFKQRTSYAHVRRTGSRLWQPSFYDHAVRRTEDITSIAQYIIDNPIRAGLIGAEENWPHQGGTLVASASARRS